MNNVDVVYTPWSNLKKTASMDVGQVGFHNQKMVNAFTVGSIAYSFPDFSSLSFALLFLHSGW